MINSSIVNKSHHYSPAFYTDKLLESTTKEIPCRFNLLQVPLAIVNTAIGALLYLPIQLFRINSLAVSIFGNYGRELSKKISKTANKLESILVFHQINELGRMWAPASLLCRVKNISKRSIIWKELDEKKYHEFKQKLIQSKDFTYKKIPLLSNEQIKKIDKDFQQSNDGICYGATFAAIKDVLSGKIENEKQLIDIIGKNKNGFSAEAAALQGLYDDLHNTTWEQLNDSIISRVKKFIAREAKINGVVDADAVFNKYTSIYMPQGQKSYIAQQKTLFISNVMASLLNLKVNKSTKFQADFSKIQSEKEVQNQFNTLPEGAYQLMFRTDEKIGHSVAYLKFDFGSYILDPNFGLLKCQKDNPYEGIERILNRYSSLRFFGKEKLDCHFKLHHIYL